MKAIRKLFKKTLFILFTLAVVFLLGTAFPSPTQAAAQYEGGSYSSSASAPKKISSLYFWGGYGYGSTLKYSKTLTGLQTDIVKLNSNQFLESRLISNGTSVYYSVRKKGSTTATVYAANLKKNTRKKICTYKISYGNFCGYYNNLIFLEKAIDEYNPGLGMRIVTYNTKSKKYKTLLKAVSEFEQYGRYFNCHAPHGDPSPVKLYVYNAYSGKKTTISYRTTLHRLFNGKLYYLEWNSTNKRFTLKYSNMTGSSKKSVTSANGSIWSINCIFSPEYAIINNNNTYTKIIYNTKKKSVSTPAAFIKLSYTYGYY